MTTDIKNALEELVRLAKRADAEDVSFLFYEEAKTFAKTVAPVLLEEMEKKTKALWFAWHELNIIRARDGVPYTCDGYKSSVCADFFSDIVDACASALGQDHAPWPPGILLVSKLKAQNAALVEALERTNARILTVAPHTAWLLD